MDDNFNYCAQIILHMEGGYSSDPRDPGNWTGGKVGKGKLRGTKFGIAAADHPDLDIAALTASEAADILRSGYWMPASCGSAPRGLDLCGFDASVNCGPGHAHSWLERSGGSVETFQAINLAYHRGLRTWRTYGPGWTSRINTVTKYALAMANSSGPLDAHEGGLPPPIQVPKAKFQPLSSWWAIQQWMGRYPPRVAQEA